ncbi:MAG: hypothetical protein ACRDF0_10150 [Candidatus Limnocylindria bacterium]
MNILRFLREQAKEYDCTVCGANHSRSDIRVLGRLDAAWIVRVTCGSCQTAIKLLVVVEGPAGATKGATRRVGLSPVKEDHPSERRRPAVSADEVLDAHEFLRAYEGGLAPLLERRARAGERRPGRAV